MYNEEGLGKSSEFIWTNFEKEIHFATLKSTMPIKLKYTYTLKFSTQHIANMIPIYAFTHRCFKLPMSVCIYFCFFFFLFSEPSDQLVPGNVCTRHEKINAISITLSAEHYEIIE